MSLLQRMALISSGQELEDLLLCIERSHLRWFGCPPCLPLEVFHAYPIREMIQGRPAEGLYIPSGLGTPQELWGELESVSEEGCLGFPPGPGASPTSDKRKEMNGWMDSCAVLSTFLESHRTLR